MDPICHTLVGAALAESGLKKRTSLATATLLIAANAPDVDFLSMFWGSETALWFRRGVTHGLLGLVVLPLLVTGVMLSWERFARRRAGRASDLRLSQIILLSYIGVATHPVLDFLNVYGIRWLMPFSDRWYYGDTLFIVDPWVWVMLAAGIFVTRRAASRETMSGSNDPPARRPASFAVRLSLLAFAAYVALMAGSNWLGRRLVANAMDAQGIVPTRMMVAPLAVNPFSRWVVIESGEGYRFGMLRWLRRPRFELYDLSYEKFPSHPVASAATRGPLPRKFLSWARFPYNRVEDRGDSYVVYIGDARYTLDPEAPWGAISVTFAKRP